jgi:hypothetical protein
MSDERRYSPPAIIGAEKRAISGNLDESKASRGRSFTSQSPRSTRATST